MYIKQYTPKKLNGFMVEPIAYNQCHKSFITISPKENNTYENQQTLVKNSARDLVVVALYSA